ncbi:MAG: sigma-70 family RNA polymerase sigma factor [Bacteroidales bacterium]|nr:sigma-70 family RNA polymerase sigma factor [Bacteroidales bacterium]MBN2819866.1 sigma-70 family RNA polymerase sigma factor [Bacteroidales bacterium]
METKEIIQHCKSGNQIAQGVLFDKYYRQMYNLSMRIIYNQKDVEDVLITAFSKVFRNIQRFEYRGDNSLVKWIKTIVINESIRFVNVKPLAVYKEELTGQEINDECYADLSGIDAERVYSIIGNMPAGYRVVFNLFALEGYSHKEISELLGITENTSKSQLRKARLYIIEKLNKIEEHENTKYRFGN